MHYFHLQIFHYSFVIIINWYQIKVAIKKIKYIERRSTIYCFSIQGQRSLLGYSVYLLIYYIVGSNIAHGLLFSKYITARKNIIIYSDISTFP